MILLYMSFEFVNILCIDENVLVMCIHLCYDSDTPFDLSFIYLTSITSIATCVAEFLQFIYEKVQRLCREKVYTYGVYCLSYL